MATEARGPCDFEPCKSTLDNYFNLLQLAEAAAAKAKQSCARFKVAHTRFIEAFLVWVVLFALAVACAQYGLLAERLCQLLWALAGAAAMMVLILFCAVFNRSREFVGLQFECTILRGEAQALQRLTFIQCPPQCRPDFPNIDCDCNP